MTITLQDGMAEWLASARVGDRVDVHMSDGTERSGKIQSVRPGQVVILLDGEVCVVSATVRISAECDCGNCNGAGDRW